MSLKIWLGDKLVDQENAVVSVFDHGLLYGDGVFEGTRVYNGKVFELDAHTDRLFVSAEAIRMKITQTKEQVKAHTIETVKANNIVDGYIRTIVTRGVGTLGLNPLTCHDPKLIIIASTIQLYPHELYENGLKVISANTVRNHPLSLPPQVKSLNYLNNIFAKMEALDHGVFEAVMYNHMGYVAEATGDNIFIIKDGVIYTPPVSAGSLDGITRKVVIKLAHEHGYQVIEKDMVKFDLHTADEFFLTGTAAEVIPVVEMDGRVIGDGKPGPITRELMEAFDRYARS